MRIVVSGTHATGKSTLISDFAARHPEYRVIGDPFDDLPDDRFHTPDARLFSAQLAIAADRLTNLPADDDVIVERGPLDFLATGIGIHQRLLPRHRGLVRHRNPQRSRWHRDRAGRAAIDDCSTQEPSVEPVPIPLHHWRVAEA